MSGDGNGLKPPDNNEEKRPSLSHRRKFSHPIDFSQISDDIGGKPSATRKTSMPNNEEPPRQLRSRAQTYAGADLFSLAQQDELNESGVIRQSEEVVRSFLVLSHERELEQELQGEASGGAEEFEADTPHIPELGILLGNPLSPSTAIGRRLAVLGDEFQQRYESDLDEMVAALLPHILTSSANTMLRDAYESFRSVALRLFEHGQITWGRIVALLCFGYRLAVALFRNGLRNFIGSMVDLVVKFIVGERIARWIAQHGGWGGVFSYQMSDSSFGGIYLFLSAALLFLVISVFNGSRK